MSSSVNAVVVSYVWGAYVFQEPIKNPGLAVVAILVMVAGMVGVTMAAAGHVEWPLRLHLAEQQWKPLPSSPTATATATGVDAGGRRCDKDKQQQFLKGVLCAIFVGVLNGSFLVPLKYANKVGTEGPRGGVLVSVTNWWEMEH